MTDNTAYVHVLHGVPDTRMQVGTMEWHLKVAFIMTYSIMPQISCQLGTKHHLNTLIEHLP